MSEENRRLFLEWLTQSHHAEAHLAGTANTAANQALQDLRTHLLRSLDRFYMKESRRRLWEVFGSHLHVDNDNCFVAELNGSDITNRFTADRVQPEFHLFGYEDTKGEPIWTFAVAATLNYPFEVTKLSLHDDDASIRKYHRVLEFLSNQCKTEHGETLKVSMPMGEFCSADSKGVS